MGYLSLLDALDALAFACQGVLLILVRLDAAPKDVAECDGLGEDEISCRCPLFLSRQCGLDAEEVLLLGLFLGEQKYGGSKLAIHE